MLWMSRSTRSSTRAERVLAQDRALGLVVELEVDPVDGEVATALLRAPDEVAAQLGPGRLRRHGRRLEDLDVGGDPLDEPPPGEQVVQAAVAVDVVVGEVEPGDPRRGQRQVVLGPVALDEPVLDDPVDLAVDQPEVAGRDGAQAALPQVEDPLDDVGVQRPARRRSPWPARGTPPGSPARCASRPLASRTRRRPVRSWLISRIARIGFSRRVVAHHDARLDHPQDEVGRADLEHRRRLAHVRVADDDVQPPVPLGVRVRLVPGVDDRPGPGGGAGDALPDVVGALGQAEHRAARGLQHLARADDELAGDEERDEDVGQPAELPVPAHEVVLVAAVGVARPSRCCS